MAISDLWAQNVLALMSLGFTYQEALGLDTEDAETFLRVAADAETASPVVHSVKFEVDARKMGRAVQRHLDARGPTDGVGRVAFEN